MTDPADKQMSHQPPVGPVDHPEATPPGQPAVPTLGSPAAGFDTKGRVHRTRISGAWVGLITAAVFLILLVVFIAQIPPRRQSISLASTGTCRLA